MKTNSKKQRRDTFKNHGARSVHIFDDVFRTMCEKMPKLLIPLINEAFGTSYTEEDKFEQLRNERHLEDKRIITDALVKICGHIYHNIIGFKENALPYDQDGYRRKLIELISRISKYITRNRKSLKKGLGDVMGGRVLKLETDKIIAESLAQGISQGIMQEKMDALERVTRNYMKLDPSLSREEAEEKAKAILN